MKFKDVKIGSKVVRVRKIYQNMDYTLVPCEPEIYTISWEGSGEKEFEETVKKGFKNEDGDWVVSASGISNRKLFECFETYEDYITGNFNPGIILDERRWKGGIEEFLEFKRKNDLKKANSIEEKRRESLSK